MKLLRWVRMRRRPEYRFDSTEEVVGFLVRFMDLYYYASLWNTGLFYASYFFSVFGYSSAHIWFKHRLMAIAPSTLTCN